MRTLQTVIPGIFVGLSVIFIPVATGAGQNYPTKPVRIITGGAGSLTDIATRLIGQQLGERWGRAVVVDNRSGAGLTIGTNLAAKAVADGYTLLLTDRTAIAVAPNLHKSLAYDPVKDFSAITSVARTSFLLVAHPSFPAANFREFIDHAKRNPGAVNIAISGPGTGSHIATELLKHMAAINLIPVQYKGGGAAITAILGGEAKAGFSTIPVAFPHVQSGKVKAYAISGKLRFKGTPDIPTVAEAGVPGYEAEFWIGMLAPARTPAAIVEKVNREIIEILQTPAIQSALLAQGADPAPRTPIEFSAFIKSEIANMKKLIEIAGVRVE